MNPVRRTYTRPMIRRRQLTIVCDTYAQQTRMTEWAEFLGLNWLYGTKLGQIRIGQNKWPVRYK